MSPPFNQKWRTFPLNLRQCYTLNNVTNANAKAWTGSAVVVEFPAVKTGLAPAYITHVDTRTVLGLTMECSILPALRCVHADVN